MAWCRPDVESASLGRAARAANEAFRLSKRENIRWPATVRLLCWSLAISKEAAMCQLLGMNSNKPATLDFSFAGFAERSGRTGEHADGWGIAVHGADGCTLIVDEHAALASPLAAAVQRQPPRGRNLVAHIRKATQGRVAPENSHPFTRTLWGKTWSFAHNGDLKTFHATAPPRFTPAGDTDSESAFCHLMAALADRFDREPPRAQLFAAVAALAAEIGAHGSFNFILSNGDVLLAHCSTRLHVVLRAYPFASASLLDCERRIDFRRHNHLDDRMAVVATEPLTTDEAWQAFAPGELRMFAGGLPHAERARAGLQISY
jgi:predicted glutamine amidotransferase